MADQATVRGGNASSKNNGSPEQQVVGGIAEFGNDISTLVELQLKLASIDLKESLGQALIPMSVAAGGLLLVVGAIPVAILGLSYLVASAFRLSLGASMLLTSVATLLLAATMTFIAFRNIGPSFSAMRRSREEFERNLNWIRTVLLHSGRSVGRRRF